MFKQVNRETAAHELHVGDRVMIDCPGDYGPYTIKSIAADDGSVSLKFEDRPSQNGWYVAGSGWTKVYVKGTPASGPCPQALTVLKHLKQAGSISGIEAQAMYRVRSLTKRISELRGVGHDIESEFKSDPINKQRYVRYHLRANVAMVA